MKRWKKVVIWVASIVVVLGIGGLFAANYAVDKVLNSMIGMSVEDIMGDTEDEEASSSEQGSENNADSSQSSSENTGNEVASDNESDTSSSSGDTATSNNTTSNEQAEDKQTDSEKTSSGYSAAVSTDKAKEVEENITVADKAKVVTTLLGSLSASDIATLQQLASGGLGVEEKKQARALLLDKLSEEQYNELIAIAAKHGLSQGKSYSEVKGE